MDVQPRREVFGLEYEWSRSAVTFPQIFDDAQDTFGCRIHQVGRCRIGALKNRDWKVDGGMMT